MSNRQILQVNILSASLILGLIPTSFDGLSVLAILMAGSVFLLQPGVLLRIRRPKLFLVK